MTKKGAFVDPAIRELTRIRDEMAASLKKLDGHINKTESKLTKAEREHNQSLRKERVDEITKDLDAYRNLRRQCVVELTRVDMALRGK
jgi:hypothetical protein